MKSSDKDTAEIVFCDNHILMAVKPFGWLTQPDESQRQSLEAFAKNWVKQKFDKPGAVFLHCIHRLDRPVFGLVLFARTSKALSRLNETSRANGIRRVYLAEVEGILPQKEALLEHYLIHGEHEAIVSKKGAPNAKQAILAYKVAAFKEHSTIIWVELQTGRYHQIRAQFSAIGHPILGDTRYRAKSGHGNEIHLACTDLFFPHPVTKEALTFHCEPPFA